LPQALLEHLTARQGEILALIRSLVTIESPTTDRTGVNRVLALVTEHVRELGGSVRVLAQPQRTDRGDQLEATWAGQSADAPLLVLIHVDTVWPQGTLERLPFRVEGDRAYGPGIYDMKASAAMLLEAVAALRALGRRPRRPLQVLFTADEEIGSFTSRELIEAAAKEAAAVLVMEGAENGGAVTARKGILYFKVMARGHASHAGMAHAEGVNAIEELAHQILTLQQMTSYVVGTTVSCGLIAGGSRTNVVPAEAYVEVDARVPSMTEAERLKAAVEGLRPHLPGAALTVSSLVKRPPLARDAGVARLYETARHLAAELGFDLPETHSGGISDGNFTAALGVPTLDGLGAVGTGAHAEHEHILLSALPQRTALLARLIELL
jgi:glutamate carboxypeptidase